MKGGSLVQVEDGDYELAVGETSAWVRIKGFSVYVQETDEGVCVDIYRDGDEMGSSIASTYAFDSEVEYMADECGNTMPKHDAKKEAR